MTKLYEALFQKEVVPQGLCNTQIEPRLISNMHNWSFLLPFKVHKRWHASDSTAHLIYRIRKDNSLPLSAVTLPGWVTRILVLNSIRAQRAANADHTLDRQKKV